MYVPAIVLKVIAGALVITGAAFAIHTITSPSQTASESAIASTSPSSTPTDTKTPEATRTGTLRPFPSSTPSPTKENFKETAIAIYAKASEELKRFVASVDSDLDDLKARRDSISTRRGVVLQSMTFPDYGDGAILNQMLSNLAQLYALEIKYIDDTTAVVTSNVSYLQGYRNTYDSEVARFLKDPNMFISLEELTAIMNLEKDDALDKKYQAKQNIITAMKNHYGNVITSEDNYTEVIALIKKALVSVGSSASTASSYYQPATVQDPYSYLTWKQQLLLTPITCTVDTGLPGHAFVTCN